jgi:uncharacterized protein YjbI with pentapeptide repeats
LQFLAEAKLIQRADERSAVISLGEVDLGGVYAPGINLSGADLSGAYWRDAVLRDAVLSNAYLMDATVTEEQLEQAESLKGATMPDGQKLKSEDNPDGPTFEDWLKDKKAREEGE